MTHPWPAWWSSERSSSDLLLQAQKPDVIVRPALTQLGLLDHVNRTHQVVTITKRGKPVARLVPLADEKPRKLYGWLAGHVLVENDIVSPTGERWEAERE